MKDTIRKYDLEERLIKYAVLITEIIEKMKNLRAANHLASQLVRSGTSPALNYGEALSAESRKDFIHKIKIILKELRESLVCLKIILQANFYEKKVTIQKAIKESNELISIFVKSVETATNNDRK